MLRKTYLAIASCVALVAFMGLSSTAYGLDDPHCAGIGNPTAIDEFSITTPDSNVEHQVSGVHGSAYACGSNLTLFGGDGTLYNHADIGVPPGVEIADSDLVPNGSYAAGASTNVLYRAVTPFFQGGVPSVVTTAPKPGCQNELDNEIVGSTPGNLPGSVLVACLYGENPLGNNYNWSVRDADGKLWTTIGPMHGIAGIEPGLTFVDMNLCGYYGPVGIEECGTSGQFQQKNGDASEPDCLNGNGIYTVTATMENGTVTPGASVCARWVSGGLQPNPRPKVYYPGGQVGPEPRHPQDISGELHGG